MYIGGSNDPKGCKHDDSSPPRLEELMVKVFGITFGTLEIEQSCAAMHHLCMCSLEHDPNPNGSSGYSTKKGRSSEAGTYWADNIK